MYAKIKGYFDEFKAYFSEFEDNFECIHLEKLYGIYFEQ